MMRKNKREQIFTGKFDSNSRGFGFVTVEGFERDLFIPQGCTGGAVYGDTVEVRITRGSLDESGHGDDGQGKRAEAEVTRILEHGVKMVVGTYHAFRRPVQKTYIKDYIMLGKRMVGKTVSLSIAGYITPDNTKIPFEVDVPADGKNGALEGHKVVSQISIYPGNGENPVGNVTEILGHVTDPGVDILSIVKGYEIPTEFPKEVTDEADRIPESVDVRSETIARQNRTDYRDLPTVTIDGEDTKDIDDAISLVREGKKWKLGVHIADVAEYVKEGSALDKEAFNRGTSVYLADRVIPMLPRKLSNGICSLNAGEDRLAMSCVMTIDENGEVSEYEISESIIHVDARLSYNGVMRLFEENDDSEIAQSLSWQGYRGIKGRTQKLARMLRNMKKLAAQLRENREKRGSIDFDFPEAKIVLDEMGRPVEISLRERTDATDLIEDFMLLANETVARHCVYLEIPSVYRVHEVPAVDKMKELAQLVRGFGYRFKPGQGDVHPSQIRNLLGKMKDRPEEAMLSRVVLRSMQKAQYATGCEGHFGLALKYYCHFTSPIRRYPDLLVHRSLKYWLRGEMDESAVDRLNLYLPGAAARSSAMEQRAAEVERETVKLKKAQYMEERIGENYTGTISGITGWGIYVELPDTVEGMIRISDLTDDFYAYDEKRYILVGERTGRTYMLGQTMNVTVAGVDTARRTIDFMPEGSDRRDTEEQDHRHFSKRGEGRKGSDPDREKGRRNGRKKLFLDRTGRILAGKSGRHTGRKKHRDRKGRK